MFATHGLVAGVAVQSVDRAKILTEARLLEFRIQLAQIVSTELGSRAESDQVEAYPALRK